MNPMISFVVPVYNVELYLEECLNSIVTQDYTNKELILVDDGSTDGSSDICEKFAEKYDYIKIIRRENSGAAFGCRHRADRSDRQDDEQSFSAAG